MAKILLVTGMMVGFAYAMEFFIAWYGGNPYEADVFLYNRLLPPFLAGEDGRYAPYWWAYWTMIFCNVVSPQLFWFRKFRTSPIWIWIVAAFVTVGMWFERFVIIVTSLHRAFLPGEWGMFHPTLVDIMVFVGTCGIFLTLFLLFLRFLPIMPIAELKAVMPQASPHHGHGDHGHGDHVHDDHGHGHGDESKKPSSGGQEGA